MRSNHEITLDGDSATVVSKGYAFNLLDQPLGDPVWEVWGWYTHTLARTGDGWRCTGMSFVVTHARGNDAVRTHLAS